MAERQTAAGQVAYFEALSTTLATLINQYAAGNAPHALMLSGQFGVGKNTLALLLAQALLCEGAGKPCGSCTSCSKILDQTHTNLLVVRTLDKQRSVKVEQARSLLSSLMTYPFAAGPRVVLLLRMDVFTPQAQNALLKAIEEPDPATFFLLTCENEDAVLTTIRSRCQIQRIPPWPDQLLKRCLMDQGLPPQEAARLTDQAGGSIGKALAIRNDTSFWEMKELVDQHVLGLKSPSYLPQASAALRSLKDQAEDLFHYLENAAARLINHPYDTSRSLMAKSLLEGVITARKHQTSNLSWQAIVDHLLIKILEDQALCPL